MCDNSCNREGKRGRKGENEPLFSHISLLCLDTPACLSRHALTLLRNVHQTHSSLYGLLLNDPNQLLHNRGSSAQFDEYRIDFIGLNMITVTYSEVIWLIVHWILMCLSGCNISLVGLGELHTTVQDHILTLDDSVMKHATKKWSAFLNFKTVHF